jgi:SNF2 family DNA or RNA helicase
MTAQNLLAPGQKISHPQFGDGVVIEHSKEGYVRAFFSVGERQVHPDSLSHATPHYEQVLTHVSSQPDQIRAAWLAYQAYALPLMEEGPALTAAKVDLLPHQVVLTHRTATSSPRRLLVADEVGLGKTIETALILRELSSRGELKRALMVVPAGLLDNWHRELNTVFNLNFEIFGTEGDVTDRKSNAFEKHDRLIASIDTLKRPERIKRILEAPKWDLVVFDEAHHLNAYKNGTKITKTENFKLAEALKGHCRDLLLLSATPHQGDHFRFWMLVQLLNPALFKDPEEMLSLRYRLNEVVIRRTKADACKPDGSPLFMRRIVNTESFTMSEEENVFYAELRTYLEEGFALARRQGTKGRALGFVMAVFQKIAASSFAAVKRTLRRRLINLTIHEAVLKDQQLDIDGRQVLYEQAKKLIHEEYNIANDQLGQGQVDRILADQKLRLLKKLDDKDLSLLADAVSGEISAADQENAALGITFALPEERSIILSLLNYFPKKTETKVEKLLSALGALWRHDPAEKVVIFATYLGTVDLLEKEINNNYPGQGVVVLRGGDQSAKLTAEKKFRMSDGPRVLICTAAGREGLNLQFSRVLFNFDLPWNPMDVEQRIGRIHRYGQKHTAQVYNLVLSDTIEGKIFLLLNDKLTDIAIAVGKIDEHGNVAEDFKSQILGQLAERLNYDKLYQDALSDPELKRTQLELEQALSNAKEARKVVFELFQDLEGFSLEDYKPFADTSAALNKLVAFLRMSLESEGMQLRTVDETTYQVISTAGQVTLTLTTNRNVARAEQKLDLLGLDHPLIQKALARWRELPASSLGICIAADVESTSVLTCWLVQATNQAGEHRSHLQTIACDVSGRRLNHLEREIEHLFAKQASKPLLSPSERDKILKSDLEPMLQRELLHKGIVSAQGSYSSKLISWIEISPVNGNTETMKTTAETSPSKPIKTPRMPKVNMELPLIVKAKPEDDLTEFEEYISDSSKIQSRPAAAEAKLLLDYAGSCGYSRDEMNQFMFTEFGITGKTFAELFTWDIMIKAARAFTTKRK